MASMAFINTIESDSYSMHKRENGSQTWIPASIKFGDQCTTTICATLFPRWSQSHTFLICINNFICLIWCLCGCRGVSSCPCGLRSIWSGLCFLWCRHWYAAPFLVRVCSCTVQTSEVLSVLFFQCRCCSILTCNWAVLFSTAPRFFACSAGVHRVHIFTRTHIHILMHTHAYTYKYDTNTNTYTLQCVCLRSTSLSTECSGKSTAWNLDQVLARRTCGCWTLLTAQRASSRVSSEYVHEM